VEAPQVSFEAARAAPAHHCGQGPARLRGYRPTALPVSPQGANGRCRRRGTHSNTAIVPEARQLTLPGVRVAAAVDQDRVLDFYIGTLGSPGGNSLTIVQPIA
jgi:hypothetical protein